MKHFKADFEWALQRLAESIKKYIFTPFYTLPHQRPFSNSEVRITKNVAVRMRDGVRLFGDLYLPVGNGPFPVVLIRMPYGKQEAYCYMPAHGKYWAGHGYACLIQDVRGKWASEGEWEPFVNEANDGYDTLDWIAAQVWCNGNIGMTGESYYGYTQWAVAPLNHPNLKCIVPGNTAADIHGSWMYVDHVFCSKTMGTWLIDMQSRRYNNPLRVDHRHLPLIEIGRDAGSPDRDYRAVLEHPEKDSFWERINVDHKFDQIQIPILHWGGWYDVFLQGTLDAWLGMKARNPNQWLLISATDHETTPMFTGRIGKLKVGKQAWSYDFVLEFFDHFLKGVENRYASKPAVELFVMGDNQWRTEEEWPLARTLYTRFYFHSDGHANGLSGSGILNTEKPLLESPDQFEYDPRSPVDFAERVDLWHLAEEMEDRSPVEARQDVLVYTTEKLQSDVEVTGPIRSDLFAASSTIDTDFTVTLVDVFPDGYAQLVQEGIVRARYRQKNHPSLIEPGQVYEYDVDLWATSYVFPAGHCIRIEISSSNSSRYDRNLNSGGRFAHDDSVLVARQTIYHDQEHPSCIVLPVIPR